MKTFEFKSRLARQTAAALALGLFMVGQTALACNADNWFAKTDATVLASGPDGPGGAASIARYSGFCAMQTTAGAEGWVEDDSPGGIDRIRARFYVLVDNSSNARIYRGFNSGGSTVFDVLVNPGNGNIALLSSGESTTCGGCANVGSWNSIEIDWNAGAGNMSISVNGGTPDSTSISTTETVSKVRLGNLNGASGFLNFDAYESRRTTEIGRLVVADANASGDITGGDLSVIAGEILGNALAEGQPDCNESGDVTGVDLSCTAAIILGL